MLPVETRYEASYTEQIAKESSKYYYEFTSGGEVRAIDDRGHLVEADIRLVEVDVLIHLNVM